MEKGKNTRCVVAFGGNLGNADETFRAAITDLEKAGLILEKVSAVITTAPVGCEAGAPDFRNGVLTGFWQGSAPELLALCQALEEKYGRPNDHAKGFSRTLDLDLILFGDEKWDTERLILPHPRAKERDFVCIPLAEIAPELLTQLWNTP